jgi:hypothetical protein
MSPPPSYLNPSPCQVHYLLPFLSKMFEKLTMRGKSLNNSGVLSFDNFDFNHGVINTFHDDHVVSKGDFEERTFLDDEGGFHDQDDGEWIV